MNSRFLLVLALCGLLMGQRAVESAPRQLLPLPEMALRASQPVDTATQVEGSAGGELHVLQPTITLTGSKEMVDNVDLNAPAIQSSIPLEVDIVKKDGILGLAGAEADKGTLVQTKDGLKTIKTVGYQGVSANGSTTVVPVVTTEKAKSAGSRISTSLFSTIVTSLATTLLLGLARKHATLN